MMMNNVPDDNRMSEATQLNNAGVALLKSHNGRQALGVLKQSLLLLNEVANDPSFAERTFQEGQNDIQLSYVELPALEELPFYVYNRAMTFDTPSDASISTASACVVFNMALTFHMTGLKTGRDSVLKKGAAMYDHCAAMLQEPQDVLALAAMNNQASTYYTLGAYDQSQVALEQVKALLEVVPLPPAHVSATSTLLLEERHMVELHLNVMTMKAPTAAASA